MAVCPQMALPAAPVAARRKPLLPADSGIKTAFRGVLVGVEDQVLVPAFVNHDRRVGRDIPQDRHHSCGRPGDGDSVDTRSVGAHAEMLGQFALSQEVTPHTDLSELRRPAQLRGDLEFCADSMPVGRLPDHFDPQPRVEIPAVISV